MRQCLARRRRRFVVPIDADDVLEPDALAVSAAIDREQRRFRLLGRRSPRRRARAHAVLEARVRSGPQHGISYIWHLSRVPAASGRSSSASTRTRGPSMPRLGHESSVSARRACGSRMCRTCSTTGARMPRRRATPDSESRLPASMRAVVERVLPPQPTRALRDRRVPALSRRCRMVDSPPADRRSGVCRRGPGGRRAIVRGRGRSCDSLALARTVVAMPGPIETLDDWRRLGEALPSDVNTRSFSGRGAGRKERTGSGRR